jgi:hypothetical protein
VTDTPATVRLTLELERQGDPVAGTITGNDAKTRAFTGWLELASLIEAERRGGAKGRLHAKSVTSHRTLGGVDEPLSARVESGSGGPKSSR